MSKSINQLFKSAQDEGLLSPEAAKALTVRDVGAEIEKAMGVSIDQVQSSEVVLVTIMPDDSGSIDAADNAPAVRDGHNEVIEALKESKQVGSILVHNRYLNGKILYPYRPLDKAVEMDDQNYEPNKGTPLYDQTVIVLGTVIAKTQDFAENGVPVRTVTLIITDGEDLHSRRSTPQDCANIIKDMLKAENHIIAAMGVDDGHTDFKQVFTEMGIPDKWILTPKNSRKEIRRAFQCFSQSALKASQGAASFKNTAAGGFGNP